MQIRRLYQKTATDTLEVKVISSGTHFDRQQTQIGLLRQNGQCFFGKGRGHDHFSKLLGNHFSTCARHGAIEGQNTAKGTLGVRLKGLGISLGAVNTHGHATRISVFDDHAGRFIKLTHGFPSCIAIGNVVVGQGFAVQLFVAGQKTRAHIHFTVERGVLVGIFTIAHVLHFDELTGKAIRELVLRAFIVQRRQIVGNHGIVASRMTEDFLRQSQTRGRRHFTVSFQLFHDTTIVGRIDHYGHTFVIFCSCTDHRRTADIDIFNGIFERAIGFGNGSFEGIEVNDHDVDRINAVIGQRFHVLGHGTASEKPRVNLRI